LSENEPLNIKNIIKKLRWQKQSQKRLTIDEDKKKLMHSLAGNGYNLKSKIRISESGQFSNYQIYLNISE